MTIMPFKREHIQMMVSQQGQDDYLPLLTPAILNVLEHGDSFTAMDGDEVIACAGVVKMTETRGHAWAYLSARIGRRLFVVTKAVQRYLEICPYPRVEMDVYCDHKAGHRWANMLGFELEAPRRRKYTPDGKDCALYARVI